MNTENTTPKSEEAAGCAAANPLCDLCGEEIDASMPNTSREFRLPNAEYSTFRHPACCPSVVFVNAYRVTLAYGGGEEGGWWYDEGEPLGSIPIDLKTDPAAFIEHYKLLYKQVQVRTKSSMGGSDLVIKIEEHMAEYFPSQKPHYE